MAKRRKLFLAELTPPSDVEMSQAGLALRESQDALERYGLVIRNFSSVTERQRKVVENNHLAPSFAAALGRSWP